MSIKPITSIEICHLCVNEGKYLHVCKVCATAWLGWAPRVSCSRTIDDETLARPVKDMNLLLFGSADPVPTEMGFLRWHSMARRVLNSSLQWAHLNPSTCGAILTGWLSWPAGSIMQGPCRSINWNRGNTHLYTETCSKQLKLNGKQSICCVLRIDADASFAYLWVCHGKFETPQQKKTRSVCQWSMRTWKWLQHDKSK